MREGMRKKRGMGLVLLFAVVLGGAACNGKTERDEFKGEQVDPNYPITLVGEVNARKIITGRRNNEEEFKIFLMDYDTVRLNQTEFYDLTGDSQMELCVGLDIANTAVSDSNAIHVYDSTSLELLFPTEDKMSVYDGRIVELKEVGLPEYGIEYTSFTKEAGISFVEENSLIGWRAGGFSTLKYNKKLLDRRGDMAVFLEDYSCYETAEVLKLSVERMGDDGEIEELQDILAELGEEADLALINQKIEEGSLVYVDGNGKNENLVIKVMPCGEDPEDIKEIVYRWDGEGERYELLSGLDKTDLSSWCGTYSYDLFYPPNIGISVDLNIYESHHNYYYGYLQASGFQTFENMTVQVKGNEKEIHVYGFDINPSTGSSFQKGSFLFSLKRDGVKLLTMWEGMFFDEKDGKWKEGFQDLGKIISPWEDEIVEDENKQVFLHDSGLWEEEPFYQYYDEEGNLQMELYYDEDRCRGAGFGTVFNKNGFWFEGYYYRTWEEKDPIDYNEYDVSDSVEDFEEFYEYDASGRLIHYKSEGIINWLKDNPGRYTVLEINFEYREDGTLCKKKYSHNPRIFGSSNQYRVSYYDSSERLEHVSSYITHGSVESYYIYEGDSREPSYCLVRDSAGGGAFIKCKLYEVIEAKG